jgi:thymidylate kinase
MKATVALFFTLSLVLSVLLPRFALFLPFVLAVAFGAYGLARSRSRHLDPLNDAPNAFRVFLASLGGYLITVDRAFVFPSVGVLLLVGSVYLNDEFQRRTIDSVRRGRRGGSVALLGIDGSGKSSHSTVTSGWLERRGYRVELMPFHRYLFVERLSSILSAVRGGSGSNRSSDQSYSGGPVSSKRRNPLRPVLSLADNLLLQISTSLGCRIEGTVVVYDRFIWSTYIKYEALGYPVRPLAFLYLLPRPYFAIVLDVPVDKSLKVIDERVAHIHYPRSVLQHEREVYLQIARRNGYPVIDATSSFDDVQAKIEGHLAGLFPQVPGARTR